MEVNPPTRSPTVEEAIYLLKASHTKEYRFLAIKHWLSLGYDDLVEAVQRKMDGKK